MALIGILLPSKSPILHDASATELVTMAGTFEFSDLVRSSDFDAGTVALDTHTVLIVRPYVHEDEAEASKFMSKLASQVVRRLATSSSEPMNSIEVAELDTNTLSVQKVREENKLWSTSSLDTADEAALKLAHPMTGSVRVATLDSKVRVIEICSRRSRDFDELARVSALVDAYTRHADYLPYRDNPLTKLVWSGMQRRKAGFTTIACIPTGEFEGQAQLFALYSRIMDWTKNGRSGPGSRVDSTVFGRIPTNGGQAPSSKHLRGKVGELLDRVLVLYTEELRSQKAVEVRRIQEREAEAERVASELRQVKTDQIRDLERQIKLLKAQASILNSERPREAKDEGTKQTWFAGELDRKRTLLAQAKGEETRLLQSIASAKKFEVGEPFRGLIRQTEFNLQSLRQRRQDLQLKRRVA